jgi:hypothetical protein
MIFVSVSEAFISVLRGHSTYFPSVIIVVFMLWHSDQEIMSELHLTYVRVLV